VCRNSVHAESRDAPASAEVGFAALTVTNTFAVLRLLPASDGDKDVEILIL
jgi:hypothetical protein